MKDKEQCGKCKRDACTDGCDCGCHLWVKTENGLVRVGATFSDRRSNPLDGFDYVVPIYEVSIDGYGQIAVENLETAKALRGAFFIAGPVEQSQRGGFRTCWELEAGRWEGFISLVH